MANKDYYSILGVNRKATAKDIKKAYRKLAAEYHPDKTKGNKVKEDRFKEIGTAYQVLGNPEKRKQNDALGSDWEQFQQSGGTYEDYMEMKNRYRRQGQYANQARDGYSSYTDNQDFSDIFESFFGGRSSGHTGKPGGFPGADVSGEISISLQEAYSGTERILEVEGNKIKLKIKPGAYTGLQLKAKGKGQQGGQGRAGDLYVKVRVGPHPEFERKGDNLYMTAGIDVFSAMLGGRLEVNTISGKVNISLKEGTQNGKIVRLKGKGMPVYGTDRVYGDLFVKLEVELPVHFTPEQKERIKSLRNSLNENIGYES
jgi:curved DNA-binding protein